MADSDSSVELLENSAAQNASSSPARAYASVPVPATNLQRSDVDVDEDADADAAVEAQRVSDGFEAWSQGQDNDDDVDTEAYDDVGEYSIPAVTASGVGDSDDGGGVGRRGLKRGRQSETGGAKKRGKIGKHMDSGEDSQQEEAKPEESIDHPAFCPACQEEHSRDLGIPLTWSTWSAFTAHNKKLWIKSHRQFHLGERFVCPAPTCGAFWHDASIMKKHCKTCRLLAHHHQQQQDAAGGQTEGASTTLFDPESSSRSVQSVTGLQPYTVYLYCNPATKAPSPAWYKACNKSLPWWFSSCQACTQVLSPAEWRLVDAEAMETTFEWHCSEHLGVTYACPVRPCKCMLPTHAAVSRHSKAAHPTKDARAFQPLVVFTRCDPSTGMPSPGYQDEDSRKVSRPGGGTDQDSIKRLFSLLRTRAPVDADEYERPDTELALAKKSATAPLNVEVTWEEGAPQPPAGMMIGLESSTGAAGAEHGKSLVPSVIAAPHCLEYGLDDGWPASCPDCAVDEELAQSIQQAETMDEEHSEAAAEQAQVMHEKVVKHRREHLGERHCCPVLGCQRNVAVKVIDSSASREQGGESSWQVMQWHIKNQHDRMGPTLPSPLVVYLLRDPATGQPSAGAVRYDPAKTVHQGTTSSSSTASAAAAALTAVSPRPQHRSAQSAVASASAATSTGSSNGAQARPRALPPTTASTTKGSKDAVKDSAARIPKRVPDSELLWPSTGVSALWPLDCYECSSSHSDSWTPHPLPHECFRTDSASKRGEAAIALGASTRSQCWIHRLQHLGEVFVCPVGAPEQVVDSGKGSSTGHSSQAVSALACRYAVRPAGPSQQDFDQALQQVQQHILASHSVESARSEIAGVPLQPLSTYLSWHPCKGQPEAALQELYASVETAALAKGAHGSTLLPVAARSDLSSFVRYLSRGTVDTVPGPVLDGTDAGMPPFVTFRPRELLGWPHNCNDTACRSIIHQLTSSSVSPLTLEHVLLVHRGVHRGESWACPHPTCTHVQRTTAKEDGCKALQQHIARAHLGFQCTFSQLVSHVSYLRKGGGTADGGALRLGAGSRDAAGAAAAGPRGSWVEEPFSAFASKVKSMSGKSLVQRLGLGRPGSQAAHVGLHVGARGTGAASGASGLLGAGGKTSASTMVHTGTGHSSVPRPPDHTFDGGVDEV